MPPRKLIGVPIVRQSANFDCGLACALAVLKMFRISRSRADVANGLSTTPIDGTDPRAMEAYFRREELRVLSGEMEADDLAHHQRLGRPVVCLVQREGTGHYVVSAGLWRGRVHYLDPAEGMRCVPLDDFLTAWSDEDRMGARYHRFALAVWR